MNSSQTKPDIYEQITNGIIAAIEAGAATYEMPWRTLSTPINASTRKPYQGVNTLCLWCLARKHHDSSQEWVTYRQWSELGAQVRRGERSATVVFSKFFDGSERSDAGDEMDSSDDSSMLHKYRCFARAYHVFNAGQVEGYTPTATPTLPESGRIENAERFFQSLPGVVSTAAPAPSTLRRPMKFMYPPSSNSNPPRATTAS